jgi:hypothetical protein
MVDMMERRGSETCINVVSRIRNTSGRKLKVMEYNLLIDSDTQLLYFKILCSSLEDGMAMIQWMIFSNIVSYLITGMKFTEPMVLHHNLDIVIRPSYAVATFTSSVVLTPTNKDSMTSISLILISVNGQKLIQLVTLRNPELFIDQSYLAI